MVQIEIKNATIERLKRFSDKEDIDDAINDSLSVLRNEIVKQAHISIKKR